jgi:hypothetical protein
VSLEEVKEKFRFVAGYNIGRNKAERVIDFITDLEKKDNIYE